MQDITIGVSSGAGGGIVGVLLTFGFLWAKSKMNGRQPQSENACPATAAKLDVLAADHTRHGVILGKLADARVEHSTLLKQQLKATETQTEILRDRLPRE